MYKVIYRCKLCGEIEEETITDTKIDKKCYPLRTVFALHECEDKSLGLHELIGYKFLKPKEEA